MSETDREAEHHGRLFDQLRAGLLDLSPSDPMLDYRHRVASRRQVRVVDCDLEQVFMELAGRRGELALVALPEAEDVPDDERSPRFLGALARARATDFDYLAKLASLDALGWQDDAAHAEVERWLRDHVRTQISLPPHPDRPAQDIAAQARARGIAPSYDLAAPPGEEPRVPTALQTLYVADELDVRLARIAADAALAEQETGLSTLFMVFGFMRWYPSAESEAARFAPLLLLPVTLSRRMEEARALYAVRAAAESPVLNPSLREWFVQAGAPALPDFDPESDGIESYLSRMAQTISGLDRWQVARNLTLGHFTLGGLAMYTDLAPEDWPDGRASHPLVEALLRGSDAAAGEVAFASDYDVDDEEIEDAAPILIDDADAAQQSAVVDVMRGKNLVIEGAPGTGKSQTIANIVANALYAGKTVLLVANKRAALDAVKWRMDVAGLGDFCLELHSGEAQPTGDSRSPLPALRHGPRPRLRAGLGDRRAQAAPRAQPCARVSRCAACRRCGRRAERIRAVLAGDRRAARICPRVRRRAPRRPVGDLRRTAGTDRRRCRCPAAVRIGGGKPRAEPRQVRRHAVVAGRLCSGRRLRRARARAIAARCPRGGDPSRRDGGRAIAEAGR